MRVLLVDDNDELRGFLAVSLQEAGIEVVEARNATEALHRLELEKFDGLIVDSVMTDGDGLDLTQKVRASKTGRNLPILLMSSISTALARRMAQNMGCTEFLVKPFGQMQFLEQVRNLK